MGVKQLEKLTCFVCRKIVGAHTHRGLERCHAKLQNNLWQTNSYLEATARERLRLLEKYEPETYKQIVGAKTEEQKELDGKLQQNEEMAKELLTNPKIESEQTKVDERPESN